MKQVFTLIVLGAASVLVLSGCGSSDTAELPKSEQANFQGKPMPADVKAKLAVGGPPPGAGAPPAAKAP